MSSGDLATKTCVPCRGGVPTLTEGEARGLLAGTPNWELQEGATRLHRRFEFEDFKKAIKLNNNRAAEEQLHEMGVSQSAR